MWFVYMKSFFVVVVNCWEILRFVSDLFFFLPHLLICFVG